MLFVTYVLLSNKTKVSHITHMWKFYVLRGKKNFAPENGGGDEGGRGGAPCPPFSTALCLYELFVFFVCSVSNSM